MRDGEVRIETPVGSHSSFGYGRLDRCTNWNNSGMSCGKAATRWFSADLSRGRQLIRCRCDGCWQENMSDDWLEISREELLVLEVLAS
jgi:hypothetical protein